MVGFHLRRKPKGARRASYVYLPNLKTHGRGIPGAPFLVGSLPTASLVAVLGGQFDAICLGAAAGWFEWDAAWPEDVAVLGIRGATSWRTFLSLWEPFWPHSARFLLIAHADEAGNQWEAGFLQSIQAKGNTVTFLQPKGSGGRDFNDIYRERRCTHSDIDAILSKAG